MPAASHAATPGPGASHPDMVLRVRAAGTRVRQLLIEGLRSRALANAMGWSRQDHEATRRAMEAVHTWLERNPQPGLHALRALLAEQWTAVRTAIPANAAGRLRLARIQDAINTLTT